VRVTKNIFEPKSSRILRCLLLSPGKGWTIRELASEAQVSSGYAHAVAAALIRNGYLMRNDANRLEVVDPIPMLNRWASYHQYVTANTFLEYYTFEREIDKVIERFGGLEREYALTGHCGAWVVAPHVRPVIVEAYVVSREEAETVAKELQLRPIPKEGNLRFAIPYDVGVFYKTQIIDGVRIVSNVQLYVDLYNYPARGAEAARAVLELIRTSWGQALLKGTTDV